MGQNENDRRDSTPLILAELKTMNGKMDDIHQLAKDNRDTLRGVGSKDSGLVGCVDANEKAIGKLESKSNRNDAIVGIGTIIGSVVGFIFGGRGP